MNGPTAVVTLDTRSLNAYFGGLMRHERELHRKYANSKEDTRPSAIVSLESLAFFLSSCLGILPGGSFRAETSTSQVLWMGAQGSSWGFSASQRWNIVEPPGVETEVVDTTNILTSAL